MLIIFDLDGTLLDSAPDICASLDKVLVQAGRTPLDFRTSRAMIGNGIKELVKQGLTVNEGNIENTELEHWLKIYFDVYRQNMTDLSTLYPSAIPTLQKLKSLKHTLALCTNKNIELTNILLEHYSLDNYFDLVIGGDSLAHKKPDPQPLLHICQQMRYSPKDSLMVGDGKNDIESAKRAGIRSVLVTYGYRSQSIDELAANYTIDDLNLLDSEILT